MKECNIVKDLLPLYIEELCSEDSREYVEAHMENCKECRERLEYLKYSELCVEAVEKKEVNGFKKLERYISGKILMGYFLFLAAVILGVVILLCTVPQVPKEVYYVLMPLVMVATGVTFYNAMFTAEDGRVPYMRFVVQGILLLGNCLFMFYIMQAVKIDSIPFGIPAYKIGPLVNAIVRVSIVVSLVFFVSYLYLVGRKKVKYSLWCNLSVLCMFLNLIYDNFLFQMSDPQTAAEYLVKNTVVLLAIFTGTSLIMKVILIKRNKQ